MRERAGTMSKKTLKVVAVLLVMAVSLPLLLFEGLYRYRLHRIGEMPPRPKVTLDELTQRAVWIANEDGPFEVQAVYVWTELWCFSGMATRFGRSAPKLGRNSASLIAKSELSRRDIGKRSLERMLAEWALSMWLTRHWSASELTQAWSEHAYFGAEIYGLEGASRRWFAKGTEELLPHELALLLALPQSPGRLNPIRYPDRAKAGRDHILRQFAEAGLLPPDVAEVESNQPLGIVLPTTEDR